MLALDVSGSVDAREYRLQLDGLATALTDPEVAGAILAPGAAPVALYAFEWSGPQFQNPLLDWTLIRDRAALDTIAETLRGVRRSPASPSTALGTALAAAGAALRDGPDCWSATIDVSGDGQSNTGPRPTDVALDGLTVNALVIETQNPPGARQEDLMAYFENQVIRGPGAFAEAASGYEDYARAMRRKLLREITALAVGATGTLPAPRQGL